MAASGPANAIVLLAAIRPVKRLSALYPRYGQRRILLFLRREGFEMSPDRCQRIWQQASRRRLESGLVVVPPWHGLGRYHRIPEITPRLTSSFSMLVPMASGPSA
tara:strand:- start:3034 stop:3348 length:315 start_codon:yes stop_codon:yes gene_type:complete